MFAHTDVSGRSMLSTHRHDSCSVPTEHQPLSLDQVAEFDQWMEVELALLEQRFADFVTGQSAAWECPDDGRGQANDWQRD